MKKLFILLCVICAFTFTAKAQILDDCESYADFTINPAGTWTYYDLDGSATYGFQGITFDNSGLAMAFISFNPTTTDPALTSLTAHSGSKILACFAASTPPNDDWLVSPQLSGVAGTISFYAKSYTNSYGLERFIVSTSTTDNASGSFTPISSGSYVEVDTAWTQFTYSYPAGTKYVAINCVSNDAFIFCIDDISISTGVGISENTSSNISIYPNPASTVLNVNAEGFNKVEITNILGQVVLTDAISSQTQLNVSNLNEGIYFVRLSGDNGTYTQKFIKK